MKAIGKHPHIIEYVEFAESVERLKETEVDDT